MQRIEKWTETYTELLKADRDGALRPEDLEKLATSAYLTGRDEECLTALERAHQGYMTRKRINEAVRCTFWLAIIHFNRGDKAQGSGWIKRGNSLLDKNNFDCPEQGLLLIPVALGALSQGDTRNALELFEKAVSIGEQYNDVDLKAIGCLGSGQAMVVQGDIKKGINILDEAMIMAKAEDIHLIAKGIIYCAGISVCRKVWDLKRAQEWTLALSRWCNSHADLVPFRGQCLVRRAEIMQLFGEWPKAMEEAEHACKRFQTSVPPATGEAYYRQGELHRLLGAFMQAENCYREAAKWGKTPQPGLALLRLTQGQLDAAKTSIVNTLREAKDTKVRVEHLPAMVRIMIAANHTEEGRTAAEELSQIADHFDVPYLYAMSSYALGNVFFAEGDLIEASRNVQKALDGWNTFNLPYEIARARELKGLIYREMGDKDSSDMDLAAAKWTFEQLNAAPDLDRVTRLLNMKLNHNNHGLTLRELQVLRRVASGKTNKSVAGELFISERTVDRHVSNIFNKLGVSSRVEASTYALKNKMLENPF